MNNINNNINFNSPGGFNLSPVLNNPRNPRASNTNIKRQLFNLNNLSIDELRLKWIELYKNNPPSFKRVFLIKGIAYKIQSLSGCSSIMDSEIDLAIKVTKERLNLSISESSVSRKKTVNLLPPPGSVIKNYHKGKEYIVKVLDDNMFQYEGKKYRSLSAIATEITGTRWNGYTFFKLKKVVSGKDLKKVVNNNKI